MGLWREEINQDVAILSSNVQPVPVKMDIPIKAAFLLIKISVAISRQMRLKWISNLQLNFMHDRKKRVQRNF